MRFKPLKFEKLISNESIFKKAIDKAKETYRPLDPGQYLYNILLKKNKEIDIFSDEYLELVYTTLISWNMNGRGAKLNDIKKFKISIREKKTKIKCLINYKIEELNEADKERVLEILEELFNDLDLVGKNYKNKKIRSKIVAFSKTLHFLLPNLIVPIDRKYTLTFFYNSKAIPTDKNIKKNNKKQFKVFQELYDKFWKIAQNFNFNKYFDNKWNFNIPKIIDNAIIGYQKLHE